MQHLNIQIKGRVQGVFYRASAVKEAERLNLKGFARNERDNSVYIEAEGDETNLQSFLKWCAKGPPMAIVSEVKTEVGDWKGFTKFEIGY